MPKQPSSRLEPKLASIPCFLETRSCRLVLRNFALLLLAVRSFADPLTEADRTTCQRLAAQCRELLQQSVVDFYLPASLDVQHGGYFEILKDGRFAPAEEKYLTLQARQCWLFSTLAHAGAEAEKNLSAARHGYAFLHDKFHDAERGGYYSKVSHAGHPTDRRKHVYLDSFALQGGYHHGRALLVSAQQLEALAEPGNSN